ncbi:MAG: DUF3098 domain-containing protein [Prevotella sp.]|nr:DUF3098 domain-containing protein [Prevotella sp.]
MDKKNLAFGRMNFILLGIGMLVVVIGFILMGGDSTTPDHYNPDIFSTRRIVVAPIVCLVGFISMIYAVVHKSKDAVAQAEVSTPKTEEDKG